MKKFSKLAAILAVCAFIFGGLLVSCSPHGTGYGLDDVQPSGGGAGGGSGGAGGGSGNPGDGGGSGGGGNPGGGDAGGGDAGGGSGGGGGAPVAVTGITLSQATATIGTGGTLTLTYTITPENATDKSVSWTSSAPDVAAVSSEGVVSALSAGSATIKVTANGGTGIVATCNVTVQANYMIMPLTLEAITAGTICVFNPQNEMKYTKNGGEKTALPAKDSGGKSEISVQVGDKVSFYGSGTTITKYSDEYGNRTYISEGTAECKVYGNIMSLVDELGFATATQVSSEAFCGLFRNYGNLIDAGNLILPATTLGNSCYMKMFQNCSKLTKAPALPATALADMCYSGMFNECLALKSAPALPATALADRCYMGMFLGCAALEIAPVLSATTLVTGCYTSMFTMCSKLKSVTCLATTNIEHGNISQWLGDAGIEVTGTKTFYKASGVRAWTEEVGSDLAGWTITDYVAPAP